MTRVRPIRRTSTTRFARMRACSLLAATCVVGATWALLADATAAQSSVAGSRSKSVPSSSAAAPPASPADELHVDFGGGSVADYIDLIGRTAGYESFVIEDRDALAALQLPPIRLRGASLRSAVDIATFSRLKDGVGQPARVEARWIGSAGPHGDAATEKFDADAAALRRSACLVRVVAAPAGTQPLERSLFDLSRIDASQDGGARRAIDAIAALVPVNGEVTAFQMTYHEPSKLLAVRGIQQDVALAAHILSSLEARRPTEPGQVTGAPGTDVGQRFAMATTVPDPITDEQLARMGKAELQSLLGELSRARQIPSLDDATRLRLKDDFNRVLLQVKAAR